MKSANDRLQIVVFYSPFGLPLAGSRECAEGLLSSEKGR
jgi:hypothetical protein